MDAVRNSAPYRILCLAGPTACGKTTIALSLAASCNGEVINADSRQVYADFPRICAQPTAEEKKDVPHHLYGILPTEEAISAGEWRQRALTKIREVSERGHIPLLVGGTGMYFQSLLHGIVPIPPIDPALRRDLEDRLERVGPLVMHGELMQCDPEYAQKIHPHDRQRIVRALEVYLQTNRTFTWWHSRKDLQKSECFGPLYVLAATPEWLQPRIAQRIENMLAAGAIEEAKAAYEKCPDPRAPGWSGIGCAELLAYILGRIPLEDAKNLWIRNTRAYAKRQNTWFRGRPEAVFFDPNNSEDLLRQALRDVEA